MYKVFRYQRYIIGISVLFYIGFVDGNILMHATCFGVLYGILDYINLDMVE
jgi:hypothetical protein